VQTNYDNILLYTDGGIRNGNIGFGFVAYNPKKINEILFAGNGLCGEGTSNAAEYKALISGLRACKDHGVKSLNIMSDSQLVVNQINRVWKMKQEELIDLREEAWRLLKEFDSWTIKWIPREQNQVADALVNEALDRKKEQRCKSKKQRN